MATKTSYSTVPKLTSNVPLPPPPPLSAIFSISAAEAAFAKLSYSLMLRGFKILSLSTMRRSGGGAELAHRSRFVLCLTSR